MAKKQTKEASAAHTMETVLESKRDKFVRLAGDRMDVILHKAEQLKDLANPTAYEYTTADVAKMQQALNEAFSEVFHRFANPGVKTAHSRFKL
jgi:chemotaxis protein histidine kinase CheA